MTLLVTQVIATKFEMSDPPTLLYHTYEFLCKLTQQSSDSNRWKQTTRNNTTKRIYSEKKLLLTKKLSKKHSYDVRNLPEKPDYEPKLIGPQYQGNLYRNDDLYDQEIL